MSNANLFNKMIGAIVPELNPSLCVHPFDAKHILLECNNHQLKIKKEFQLLINLVNGTNNINNITSQYCSITNQNISEDFIYRLLFDDLAVYGIIKSDRPVKIRERSLHLKLSVIFWKGRSLNVISKIISPLFNPAFFYSSLLLMLLFITPLIVHFNHIGLNKALKFRNIVLYAAISFIVVMLHELGHVAACYKYGAKHKGIGFGFYLFSPTFFADVSDAWKLPARERIIINLAGIYIEFIIVTILFGCFVATKNEILFYSGITILFHVVINLNPLLKYDGYWVLSDITGTSNLRSQSTQRLKNAFSINKLKQFSSKDFALLVYAISSYLTIGLVLFLLFFYDSESILHFPIRFLYIFINIKNIIALDFATLFQQLVKNGISIIFYITLIRFLYNTLKSYLNKTNTQHEK